MMSERKKEKKPTLKNTTTTKSKDQYKFVVKSPKTTDFTNIDSIYFNQDEDSRLLNEVLLNNEKFEL